MGRPDAVPEVRRIVSLLPSATEIVYALGLGPRLVGVSHSCDYPEAVRDLPRLSHPRFRTAGLTAGEIDAAVRQALREHGSVYEVDEAALAALDPDLVLTQGICEVCAVPEREVLASVRGLAAQVLALDAHDVTAIIAGIRAVGDTAGVPDRAAACVRALAERVATVRARVDGRPRPRVVALEWLDPPYVPGHWIPELIDAAGGELLLGERGRPSYPVTGETLRRLDPDVLLVMPCGFALLEAREDATRHNAMLRSVAPRAVAGGRAYVLDAAAYLSRSGPRFADGVELLATLLHPGAVPDGSLAGRAEHWP